MEYDYIYLLAEGGILLREDALNYRNLLPGDEPKKVEKKVSVYESLSLVNKETGETASLDVNTGAFSLGLSGQVNITPRSTKYIPPVSESVKIKEEVSSPGAEEKKRIVHEDIDKRSIKWASQRIRKLYQKHSVKARITVPLIAVKVGQKVNALGRLWVIEGFSHTISPTLATTTLYLREL